MKGRGAVTPSSASPHHRTGGSTHLKHQPSGESAPNAPVARGIPDAPGAPMIAEGRDVEDATSCQVITVHSSPVKKP